MLEGTSSSGKFKVQVNCISSDIGSDNLFGVKFFDAVTGSEISNATYSIMLFKGQEHLNECPIEKARQLHSRHIHLMSKVAIH
jgi:hypothetical protein